MTNLQRLTIVLAFIFAVLIGVLAATTLVGGKGGAAPTTRPSPSTAAVSTAPSAAANASTAPSASASTSPSPTPTPTPSPTPTAKPAPGATITFVQLALDAATDAGGTTRTITFAAQPQTVTVSFKTESGGNTKACLSAGGSQLACRTGVSGTLTGKMAKIANFQLTLRGDGAATPVVTVTINFAANQPSVTIANARFDGTASPAFNGLQVVATPRAKGTYKVTANWGGHPFLYEVDLIEQGGPGLKTVKATTGATQTSQGFAVAPPNPWMIVVKNAETGFGVTGLTATFTWP